MALSNATLSSGATISVTGGSTVTFAPSGTEVPEGIEIIDIGAADFRVRTKISCRSKMPAYNAATGVYSKGKRYVSVTMPIILADGTTSFPVARLELDDHVEETAAHRLELRKFLAQLLLDTDFDTFFTTGSKA